ncbi:MAG TPA: alpha/beta hydrolase [Hyphomicrobiales bacterium]|nr:alpha/beta hydrolase [Rhodobiaceae bacterium]HXK53181.1 alpha/beta hydrolase [Hyphomicrobiales bacterium]
MTSADAPIEIEDSGSGPCILLLPGSFSTAAAWRPLRRLLEPRYRVIAASLPGYGGSAERRGQSRTGIAPFYPFIRQLAGIAGTAVHLVGHSFGASVALAGALSGEIEVASLTLVEAIPLHLLQGRSGGRKAAGYIAEIRSVHAEYAGAFARGDKDAARLVIDMWSGAGTFDALAEPVRDYARRTVAVNLRDWESAWDFAPGARQLAAFSGPGAIVHGSASHPSISLMAGLLEAAMPGARRFSVDGASHFLPFTHAGQLAEIIERTGSLAKDRGNAGGRTSPAPR